MNEQSPELARLALAGGEKLTVMFRDGSKAEVTVSLLTIRQLAEYDRIFTDEAAQTELFCGKPAGWADTLTVESHEAVIALGQRINQDPFVRWAKRLRDRGAALASQLSSKVA